MILLLGLVFLLWGEAGWCLEENGVFTYVGDIRHFAVANNTVYIATEEKLYQLSHNLTLVHSVTQRGVLKVRKQTEEQFNRVSGWNATFSVNVLLPFIKNNTLITCGVVSVSDNHCGYCEVLDLENISHRLHSEGVQVGPLKRSNTSVVFLVDVEKTPTLADTFILTAMQQYKKNSCPTEMKAINLQNTDEDQSGGTFSFTGADSTPVIDSQGDVEFVDGFQISSVIYLLSNVPSGAKSNRVRLIWLEGKTSKKLTLESVRGAILTLPEGGEGSRLLASSVITGQQPVLWSGVFSVDGGRTNTELVVFDVTPDLTLDPDKDPDFYTKGKSNVKPKTLKPEAVLFRQKYMTSVLAVKQKSWMVFFIGTGDGQLIKLTVDRNYHAACPRVLYRANDDRQVFPKIRLDPVDHKHVYVSFRNQMRRVPVSQCSTYTKLQECWSAQDPHCVWCNSDQRCKFEDDCRDSDWLSIPDVSQQKMVSHKVVKDQSGQITLNIQTHLTVRPEAPSNFTCQFSGTSRELCSRNNPPPKFPQCNCILSESTLPADGLYFTVKIRLGTIQLSEKLKLRNCSAISGPPRSVLCQQCMEAGCGWSTDGCSWAGQGVVTDSVCQKIESGRNLSRPEISSITPSVVSFYGRNHALLLGRNLQDVTRVRIQADMDCTPKESLVWNNTGVNLTFHVPSTDNKGVVQVCALLPDGSCHGNTKITYQSLPSCTNIAPNRTWISGKRKTKVMGSHLEFVEKLKHSHAKQELTPTNSSDQSFTYETPAAETTQGVFISTVSLKVANQTLTCSTKVTYYPEPEFTSFTSTWIGNDVRITIQKKADKLEMTTADLLVWGVQDGKEYRCIMEDKETSNETDFFNCEIQSLPDASFQELKIKYGDITISLWPPSVIHQVLMILRLLLIPCVIAVLVILYQWQKKLTTEINKL